jgi:hypothetical protein
MHPAFASRRVASSSFSVMKMTGTSIPTRSAQTIVKHCRAPNVDRADAGIDRLELQVARKG